MKRRVGKSANTTLESFLSGKQKGRGEKFGEMKQTKWNNVKQEKNHKLTSRLTM